jgi:hypothetical protein
MKSDEQIINTLAIINVTIHTVSIIQTQVAAVIHSLA